MAERNVQELSTVMIPVRDQDRAIAFYRDALGLEVRRDIPFGEGGGDRWIEVGPPGGGATLALTPERGEEWVAGRMTGVSLTVADIDALHASLHEAGVDADAEVLRVDGPPPPMFWFRDADGNQLLLVGADPEA